MEIKIFTDNLLNYMETIGFSLGTLGNMKRNYAYLIRHSQGDADKTIPEQIDTWLEDSKRAITTDTDKRRYVKWHHCGRILKEFFVEGEITNTLHFLTPKGIVLENECNLQLLESFSLSLQERELSRSTQEIYKCVAQKFLLFLEETGIGSVEKAKKGIIGKFFVWLSPTWNEGSIRSLCLNFRPFLRFALREDLVEEIPRRLPAVTRIIPVLNNYEWIHLFDAIGSPQLSFRDKSICYLLMVYGLRAVDIITMKKDDIDWNHGSISIIQHKTKNPLLLPLYPIVGNAIYSYIKKERQHSCESPILFLSSSNAFPEPLRDHSACYFITNKLFKIAGVRQGDGKRKGTHIFRYSIASKLLINGIPMPTISTLLGHVDLDSTNRYVSTNNQLMRSCCLPLDGIPSLREALR